MNDINLYYKRLRAILLYLAFVLLVLFLVFGKAEKNEYFQILIYVSLYFAYLLVAGLTFPALSIKNGKLRRRTFEYGIFIYKKYDLLKVKSMRIEKNVLIIDGIATIRISLNSLTKKSIENLNKYLKFNENTGATEET